MKTQLRNIIGSYETKNNKRKDHFEKAQNKPMLSEMSSEEQAIDKHYQVLSLQRLLHYKGDVYVFKNST